MKQKITWAQTSSIPKGSFDASNPNIIDMKGADLHHRLTAEQMVQLILCGYIQMITCECVQCQQVTPSDLDNSHLYGSYSLCNDCDEILFDCCCECEKLVIHKNSPKMGMSLHFSYSQTKNVHTKINNLTQKIEKVNSNIQHLNSKSIDANNSLQRLSQECSTLRTNYQERSHFISKLKSEQEMLEQSFVALRQKLEDIHYATYNGSFIWRITNVAQKLDDARAKRQTSIYSPLFYSSPTGYKMRARLYMYGDGDARSTHMSIFLVLLKGEYDPILTWPFNFPVTFCLYDQTGQGHHTIDSSYPDTSSISIQKPRSEMNIASGIPKFYPLAMIERPETCYIRDDTMFINIKVHFDSVPKMLLPYTVDIDPGLPTYVQEGKRRQIIEQRMQSRAALVAQIKENDRQVSELSLIPEYQQDPTRVRQPPPATTTNSEGVPCEDIPDNQ